MAASVVEGVPTVARIENGATVENEVEFELTSLNSIRLNLRNPDFTTAMRVTEAIQERMGSNSARALDSATVEVGLRGSGKGDVPEVLSVIENLRVEPDSIAKVVIDARSGTIVIGADVRIDRVAVSQGGLTVMVREDPMVSQPNPVTIGGTTVVVPRTSVGVEESEAHFTILEGADVSLQRLVDALNAIGLTATQTISILQAIKAAGALHADLEII
ncbi:P-ring protein (plasmid) [Salipiger abyssi]|uniref:Flagellar P-ring protein n=2 Tax=Salipiger abyssi TaxID=1250539 RepID=A0A1P8UM77_9RHOB|nr:P-ring protein [Salipiger abyssi]